VPYKDPAVRAAKQAAWRLANADRIAGYRYPEKIAASNAAFRKANPEYFKEYYRSARYRELDAKRKATPEYRAKEAKYRQNVRATPEHKAKQKSRDARRDPAKLKDYWKAYWKRPEVLAVQRDRMAKRLADPVKAAAHRERKRLWTRTNGVNRYRCGTPAYRLQRRMSAAVRRCLRGDKAAGSKWLDLVGYSAAELHAHIEKQFLPKMGWHNMPKWHIDHILPLALFRFSSSDDPEFKAAWALTNLRPLWAPENIRKQDKREHLL
jgi:hypothetical protein